MDFRGKYEMIKMDGNVGGDLFLDEKVFFKYKSNDEIG